MVQMTKIAQEDTTRMKSNGEAKSITRLMEVLETLLFISNITSSLPQRVIVTLHP